MTNLLKNIDEIGTLLGVIITAFATIALWRQTKALALETKRLVGATSAPHVVMTIGRNLWSFSHFQIEIANSGNATAYDIEIRTRPPLNELDARNLVGPPMPFERIGVLAPNQSLISELGDYASLKGKTIDVETSWSRAHGSGVREVNRYSMSIADFEGQSQLGESNPLVKLANDFKRFSDAMSSALNGARPMRVDIYDRADREARAEEARRQREAFRKKHQTDSAE